MCGKEATHLDVVNGERKTEGVMKLEYEKEDEEFSDERVAFMGTEVIE